MWNWTTWLTKHLVHIGVTAKGVIGGIYIIPKNVKAFGAKIANFWFGVIVIGIIFVLWRKYKR